MASKELVDFINDELPNNGEWWQVESATKLHGVCGKMLALGIKTDDIKEIITDIYYATVAEYGC